MRTDYKRHPLSAMFGDMTDGEFNSLKTGIEINGIDDEYRVITTLDGMILDGWHRYKAALAILQNSMLSGDIDTRLEFKEFDGDDPAWFVLRNNFLRRNLSVGVRAAIVVEAYEFQPHGGAYRNSNFKVKNNDSNFERSHDPSKKTLSINEMAKLANTSPGTIKRIKRLHKEAPDIFDDVKTGKLKDLNAGTKALENRINDKIRLASLSRKSSELAEMVRQGKLTLDAADKELKKRDALADKTKLWIEKYRNDYPDIAAKLADGDITLKEADSDRKAENKRKSDVDKWCRDNFKSRDLTKKVRSGEMEVADAQKEVVRRRGIHAQVVNIIGVGNVADAVMRGELTDEQVEVEIANHLEANPTEQPDVKLNKDVDPELHSKSAREKIEDILKEPIEIDSEDMIESIKDPWLRVVNELHWSVISVPKHAKGFDSDDLKAVRRQFAMLTHPDKAELPMLSETQIELWNYIVFQEFGNILEKTEDYINRIRNGEDDLPNMFS